MLTVIGLSIILSILFWLSYTMIRNDLVNDKTRDKIIFTALMVLGLWIVTFINFINFLWS
jgi:hypothetical protein